jgi:hypothetical protein
MAIGGFLGKIAPDGTPVDDSGTTPGGPPTTLPIRKIKPPEGARDVNPWIPVKPPIYVPLDPVITPPPPDTTPAPLVCPVGSHKLAPGSTRTYADGTTFTNTTNADICAPDEHGSTVPVVTQTPATGTSTSGPGTSTTGTTGASATGGAADTDLIKTLMGLMAAQYAGAGVSGGGSGFTGTVSAPIASDATGDVADQSSTIAHRRLLLVLAIVGIGAGVWYYRKHHHGARK